MIGIIVATHGPMAVGLKYSLEMVVGPQQNFITISLLPGESLDDFIIDLKERLKELDLCDGIIALVDMRGGTPFNAICSVALEFPNLIGITGVNLPMLAEVCQSRDDMTLKGLEELAMEIGRGSVFSVNKLLAEIA